MTHLKHHLVKPLFNLCLSEVLLCCVRGVDTVVDADGNADGTW